jgi:hypothetical protein
MTRIVRTQYGYKRPPRKCAQAAAIEGPAAITARLASSSQSQPPSLLRLRPTMTGSPSLRRRAGDRHHGGRKRRISDGPLSVGDSGPGADRTAGSAVPAYPVA